MLLNYKCNSCRNRSVCKRYDNLKDAIESIKRSEDRKSGYGTDVMIELGKSDDGLILELKCDLYQNTNNIAWRDSYGNTEYLPEGPH